MAVLFACSGCGAKYEVGDELAGKRILCRQCQQRGVVSGLGAATAATAAAATTAKPTRRGMNWFLLTLLGVGSIGTGALLTRWSGFRHWHPFRPKPTDDGGPRWFGGPRGPKDGKDRKGKDAAGPAT